MRAILAGIVMAAVLMAGASPGDAKRAALVIGNANYAALPRLKNPANDAKLILETLAKVGFDAAVVQTDTSLVDFRSSLRRFRDLANGADVALFYFAGHGLEVNGTNYLVPTDAGITTEREVDAAAIPVQLVLDAMRGAETRILILDACRDNPLSDGAHRGLGRLETDNVVILFAAAPGATAMDGAGPNSPFAEALAKRLDEPGVAVQDLGLHVRFDVLRATGDRQSPHVSANVAPNKIYLAGSSQVRVDFSAGAMAAAPTYMVAAEPYLRKGPISLTVADRSPASSRIVFVNNAGLYQGRAVEPTASQVFLTQIETGNVPASFTLRFSAPLSSVTFLVPRGYPATTSGITFPAWRATAFDARGQELSSVGEGLVRSFGDVPARTHKLTAPAFEGIASLRFASDPNLNGRPFAAFSAVLIEQMTLELKR